MIKPKELGPLYVPTWSEYMEMRLIDLPVQGGIITSHMGDSTLAYELPAASLAIPRLSARQRNQLVVDGRDCKVRDLLRTVVNGGGADAMGSIFNTDARREQLVETLIWFFRTERSWRGKRRRDARFSWVVPPRETGHSVAKLVRDHIDPVLAQPRLPLSEGSRTRDELDVLVRVRNGLMSDPTADQWLRFLSVEGADTILRMRPSNRSLLMTAFARASRELLDSSLHGPWEPECPRSVHAIPITWLYQFQPVPRCEEALADLVRVGYTNVGHLLVLSPRAWQTIRSFRLEEWRAFRVRLHGIQA